MSATREYVPLKSPVDIESEGRSTLYHRDNEARGCTALSAEGPSTNVGTSRNTPVTRGPGEMKKETTLARHRARLPEGSLAWVRSWAGALVAPEVPPLQTSEAPARIPAGGSALATRV